MVVLAHGDLARLQGLLELGLVAVPEFHVGFDGGEFVEDLLDAFLGVQHLGAAEIGGSGHFQQEGVGGERQQAELVLLVRAPHVAPGRGGFGEDLGVGDECNVP